MSISLPTFVKTIEPFSIFDILVIDLSALSLFVDCISNYVILRAFYVIKHIFHCLMIIYVMSRLYLALLVVHISEYNVQNTFPKYLPNDLLFVSVRLRLFEFRFLSLFLCNRRYSVVFSFSSILLSNSVSVVLVIFTLKVD